MTVNQRKRELKKKYIEPNKVLTDGRRAVLVCVLLIFFARISFFIFELAFFAAKGITVSIISNLLILPLCLILYMIYDGNKGIASILSISAIVRVVVHFATVQDEVAAAGGGIYTGILIGVMVLQFLVSVTVSVPAKSQAYFKVMQKINITVQKEFLGKTGRR